MPSTVGIVASGVFRPDRLLGLAAWFDAADATTITASGSPLRVSQWDDKSGNGRHVSQSNSILQPTYGAENLNGIPVVRAVNSPREVLVRISAFSLTAFTMALVWRPVALVGGFAVAVSLNDGGSGMGVRPTLAPYDNQFASTFQAANNTATLNVWATHVSAAEPNAQTLRWNGATVQTATAATAATSLNRLVIGKQTDTGVFDAGTKDIAEVLVYDRALTLPEIEQVEAYFSAKWGI